MPNITLSWLDYLALLICIIFCTIFSRIADTLYDKTKKAWSTATTTLSGMIKFLAYGLGYIFGSICYGFSLCFTLLILSPMLPTKIDSASISSFTSGLLIAALFVFAITQWYTTRRLSYINTKYKEMLESMKWVYEDEPEVAQAEQKEDTLSKKAV